MNIEIKNVTSYEGLAQAFSIRSIVYMQEQACPYDEEFDGNDFCATHIVGYVNGEPAGTIRLRWFADFAKYERVAVLPPFRGGDFTRKLMGYAFDLIRRKGYRLIYGHAQKALAPHWAKYGFVALDKGKKLTYSDYEYIEMVCKLEAHPQAITPDTDAYVILRPEGEWDKPGILDASATRPAKNA